MIKKTDVTPPKRTVSGAAPARALAPAPGKPFFVGGAIVSFLVSLALYLRTMDPSASFWDCGEFIATSYTLGIPHSPGTPLYVLIGRVFTLLPLPLSIAGRVNFLSVISGALGVVFVFILVVRFLDYMNGRSQTLLETVAKVSGALTAALFIAFSNTYWWNATEAEVYALSTFFMGFMTWLGLRWAENPTGSHATAFIYFVFYLLSLSVGFHLGTILAFSGIFFLVLMTKNKSFSNTEFLLACAGIAIFVADATLYRAGDATVVMLIILAIILGAQYVRSKSVFAAVCMGLFVLGISVHLYLMIRSAHNPLIDEGDPERWRALYAALRREQYPPSNVFERKASFGFQLQHFNGYFQSQFQLARMYVGQLNLGSIIPIALGIWGMVDQYTKHRKTFVMLFVTLMVMSLGMILYLNFSADEVRERDYFYLPAFYYFAIYIGIGAGSLLAEAKRLGARAGLSPTAGVALPAIVLLILPFFSARHHFWSHDRSQDYVCSEYAKNMLIGLDKDSIIFTNGDNDTFPLWYIQEVEKYRTDIRVVNLSLLNTPWYIKQLRDNEPMLNIPWTDADLQRLTPVQTKDGWLLVRDIAVNFILKNNKNRPIYFAVTIPPDIYAPYRDFLEMQGLAYRVVPRKGEAMVNRELLEDNIYNKFSYKGLLTEDFQPDTSLYHPPYVRRLVQNYAAAFTQLAFVAVRDDDDYCEGAKHLAVAGAISPQLPPVRVWLGWYHFECGDTAKAITYYEDLCTRDNDPEMCYRLAGLYERIGDLRASLEVLDAMTRRYPDHRDALLSAVGIALRFELTDQALQYLNNWITRHPNDNAMIEKRDQLLQELSTGGESQPSEQ